MGWPVKKLFTFGFLTQLAFWVILFTFVLSLSSFVIGWPQALYRSILIFCCHLVNFYVCFSWIIPNYYEKKKIATAFIGMGVLIVALTPFRVLIEREFLTGIELQSRVGSTGRLGVIIFTETAITAFASLLRLAASHESSKQKITELEKLHLEAELRFLKSQMNPHFLFNTINNIYSLTLVKSDKAPEALMKLSGLLRYLLYECNQNVTLQKELDALQSYVELFRLKFPHNINLVLENKAEQPDKMLLEPLLLIPLLENSLKHSGLGLVPTAFVSFHIRQQEGRLAVHIENSKGSSRPESEPGGIGLENIRKRLNRAYPDRHHFTIADDQNKFEVTLELSI